MTVCAVGLMTACTQKQAVVSVPQSQIDLEKLIDSIDYDMDITGLPMGDVRTLSYAPAATRGFPMKDAYVRAMYETTTWYDSLMWAFEDLSPAHMEKIPMKEGEDWYDYYDRAINEANVLGYSEKELAFIKRLQAREEELKKLNFEVEEGLRVNVGNLANPHQIKEFDEKLSLQLAKDGFGIVPANYNQLFNVYEANDYADFPSFVTTDLYLQIFHLYIDCMLREVEENKLLPLMVKFCRDMHEMLYNMERWAGEDETVEKLAHHNATFYNIAYKLFTDKYISEPEPGDVAIDEVNKVMASVNAPSDFMADFHEIAFAYSLFRPRGHYTRSEALKRYFRGMMWLQTVPFGMDNKEEVLAAIQQACALKLDKESQKNYQTLNELITYLMGKSDDLSLMQVMAEVEKTGLQMQDLIHNEQAVAKIASTLTKIGNAQTRIRPKFEKTSHNKINVMPQRYQPDGEVLLKMVDYSTSSLRWA